MQSTYTLWTDGSCSPNPGPGGWAVTVNGAAISGHERATTNNRMELMAAIRGLEATEVGAEVKVFTDSQYVSRNLVRVPVWIRAGWMRGKGFHKAPIPNADLWLRLFEAARLRRVTMVWVRGHSGIRENERVDRLAGEERQRAAREDGERQRRRVERCEPKLSDFDLPVDF